MHPRLITLTLLTALLAAGCGDDDIRVYTAPRDEPPAQAAQPAHTDQAQASPAGDPVSWTLPEGWTAQRGSGMRLATLTIDPGPPALELTVIPLAMMAGDVLDNVNRWRGQVGLDAVTAEQLPDAVETIDVAGKPVTFLDAPSADGSQRLVAAMTDAGGRMWFFKTLGPAETVGKHIADIRAFVASLRFDGARPMQVQPPPQATTPGSATPSASGGTSGGDPNDMSSQTVPVPQSDWTIRYDTPASWHVDPNASAMRVASFIIGNVDDAELRGEVTVTRFPGQVGGLLANLNRWRGQVNLPALDDLAQQDMLHLEVAGEQGVGIDLLEPMADHIAAESERRRLVVVLVPRPEMTWFFKMSGPSGVLDQNKDAFAAFIQSVKFVQEAK